MSFEPVEPVGPAPMTVTDVSAAKSAEVWRLDFARAGKALQSLEHDEPRLGARDRAVMRARHDGAGRHQRFLAHVALRVLLERAAGSGVRGEDLQRSLGAKPRLPGCAGIDFSLAHGEDAALIGIARGAAIGVDLEHVRPVRIAKAHRMRILWVGAALRGDEEVELPTEEAFMRAWVRLEAVAKADGRGLAATLVALGARHARQCGSRSEVVARVLGHLARTGLKVHDLAPGLGSVAALALDRDLRLPVLRAFPVDRAGIEALLSQPAPERPTV